MEIDESTKGWGNLHSFMLTLQRQLLENYATVGLPGVMDTEVHRYWTSKMISATTDFIFALENTVKECNEMGK